MSTTTAIEEKEMSISLFFQEGSSDKQYNISLEKEGTGFVVNFSYGRRGNCTNTGSKTAGPIPYQLALKIYQKLVREKMAKGYQPSAGADTSFL